MKTDVRNYDAVEFWISETVKRFGRLDGAANIAGIIPKSLGVTSMAEQDIDDWNLVFSVSAKSVDHEDIHNSRGTSTNCRVVVVLIHIMVRVGQRHWHDELHEGSTHSHE